jgi:hypothetical protein
MRGPRKRDDEVGLTEIASLLGRCRQTAYLKIRTGEIDGGRLVAGRLWVAPRQSVLRYLEKSGEREQSLVTT